MSKPDREAKLDRDHKALSIRRQCPLLSRSRLGGVPLMRRLDELYTAHPFLGSRRMIAMLRAEELRILPTPYWRRRAAVPGRVRDFGWPT